MSGWKCVAALPWRKSETEAEKDLAALNKGTDLYYQERKLQLEANIDFYCRTFELLRRYKNLLEQLKNAPKRVL